MSDRTPVAGTIRGELYGLQIAVQQAIAGVIVRDVTVRNRDYTNVYSGPFPLITIRYGMYRIELVSGGRPLNVGQKLTHPNMYTIELEDALQIANAPSESEAVAESQDDLIDLADAINAWFDHEPNRCLPTPHGNMARLAGLPIVFQGIPPYKSDDGVDTRVVFQGAVGVMGPGRTGSLT